MIIRSNKALKQYNNIASKPVSNPVVVEEVKSAINEINRKKKNNKKVTPAPVVEEPVVEVVEEDKIDLSEWLKEENIED